jgi:bifunctional NMN adenylyltransferase/nudix hydrolase
VAVTRETDDGELEILLAKKPGEKGYRLIGGCVWPTNGSLEGAARQEVVEEAHIEVSALENIGSYLVDDWRYRNEIDKVMTTVFLARYMFVAIQPDEDIEELKWFRLNRKFDVGYLVASHKPPLYGVLDAIERVFGATIE